MLLGWKMEHGNWLELVGKAKEARSNFSSKKNIYIATINENGSQAAKVLSTLGSLFGGGVGWQVINMRNK